MPVMRYSLSGIGVEGAGVTTVQRAGVQSHTPPASPPTRQPFGPAASP